MNSLQGKQANYTFLSSMLPEQLREQVKKRSSRNMSDAADALEAHIFEGLCANLSQTPRIINVLPIGSYPQYYSQPFVSKGFFCAGGRSDHVNVGYCNVKLVRKRSMEHGVYAVLDAHLSKLKEPGVLIVYSAAAHLLTPVARLKKKYPQMKVCVVIADLPNMSNLSQNKSLLKKLFIRYLSDKSYRAMECVDCFALLTRHMADYMHITQPYCVMEGIATENHPCVPPDSLGQEKIILYTGTLHRRFGILHLLEAFQHIQDADCRLAICGLGDSEAEIRDAARRDSRINFMGQIDRLEILRLQGKAAVLVNPRQNNEDFTKYSFPSKILEYLSSGTPVIAYKLDGIPDEYDPYIIYPEDQSTEALSATLQTVCGMTQDQRSAIGSKGREFVLTQKNSRAQVKKIVDLIRLTSGD